jgi:hypothetical protein
MSHDESDVLISRENKYDMSKILVNGNSALA